MCSFVDLVKSSKIFEKRFNQYNKVTKELDFQYLFNPLSTAWSGLFLVKLMTVNITTKLEDFA